MNRRIPSERHKKLEDGAERKGHYLIGKRIVTYNDIESESKGSREIILEHYQNMNIFITLTNGLFAIIIR